jgi:hypothetical protein
MGLFSEKGRNMGNVAAGSSFESFALTVIIM